MEQGWTTGHPCYSTSRQDHQDTTAHRFDYSEYLGTAQCPVRKQHRRSVGQGGSYTGKGTSVTLCYHWRGHTSTKKSTINYQHTLRLFDSEMMTYASIASCWIAHNWDNYNRAYQIAQNVLFAINLSSWPLFAGPFHEGHISFRWGFGWDHSKS